MNDRGALKTTEHLLIAAIALFFIAIALAGLRLFELGTRPGVSLQYDFFTGILPACLSFFVGWNVVFYLTRRRALLQKDRGKVRALSVSWMISAFLVLVIWLTASASLMPSGLPVYDWMIIVSAGFVTALIPFVSLVTTTDL